MLEVVDEGIASASHHMKRDRDMLGNGNARVRLSLYEWASFSITHGLFAKIEGVLATDACHNNGIEVVARPTGGGILFHEQDVPFSLFIPNGPTGSGEPVEGLWSRIQGFLLEQVKPYLEGDCLEGAVEEVSCAGRFCMTEMRPCDFVWKGRKFGGSSFRKKQAGVLCQASIFFGCSPLRRCEPYVTEPHILKKMERALLHIKNLKKERLKEIIVLSVERSL